jgi:hypothetical protein
LITRFKLKHSTIKRKAGVNYSYAPATGGSRNLVNLEKVSTMSAYNNWTDLFGRTADRGDGTPRFSLKGTKAYLYEYDGYSGGHHELDLIISLLKSNHIECGVSGADSPMNVANYEYAYYFDDGGFEIYAGNYFFGTPGQGAFVFGFKALRWLLGELGVKQPRRFKNEVKVIIGSGVENEDNEASENTGIDNFALHKLVDQYIAKKEEGNPS